MPAVVHLDFETRSAVDLRKVGAQRYAMDPSTEVICATIRVGNGKLQRWNPGDPEIEIAGATLLAHNAAFERAIWNHTLKWRPLGIGEQDCTMARGLAHGLPASLEQLGKALGAPIQKDKDGHRLMLKMCRPRRVGDDGSVEWWDGQEDRDRLALYCDRDVEAECAIDDRLPALSERERRVWILDQRINDRGVALDVPAVRAALLAVAEAKRRADRRIWKLTNGAIDKVTQAKKIVDWINAQGVPCESVAEGEHEELIVGAEVFALPDVEAVVRLRAATAKAFKYEAMLNQLCPDGRVRGSLGYHGTVQGRWAGRGVQFQNMKRVETDEDSADVVLAVSVIKNGFSPEAMTDRLELLFGEPLNILSLCTRSMVVAGPDQRLIGGDYKNIEGRINAWLAGQADKLNAFRLYDQGLGPDLYKVTAGGIIGCAPEAVTRAQRQEQGKVPELACGYQGGLGAFKKMGAKYGVRLSDPQIRTIVSGWRETNPMIVDSWRILQDAAIEAVGARGCVVSVLGDRIRYAADAKFLYCKLPSGRVIHYPFPKLAWTSKTIKVDGDEITFNRNTVSYLSAKGFREDLYGGSQCAHVVSGIARDKMVEGMFAVEAAGYPIVLTIHDELLAERSIGEGSVEEFEALLLEDTDWLAGCPISASTWEGPRYVK